MLVLTRKSGQAIYVDGPATIRVTVVGGRAMLMIDADKTTSVIREELLERAAKEPGRDDDHDPRP
jgi:carbon storage regulator CsrA